MRYVETTTTAATFEAGSCSRQVCWEV